MTFRDLEYFHCLQQTSPMIRLKAFQTNQTSRILTIIVGETFPFDLRMLKSFRCLRPLKMVSKVPSKFKTCD